MNDRDIAELLEPKTPWKGTDFVFLSASALARLIQVKEISILEVDGNYTQVTVAGGGEKMMVRRSLTACENRLDPKVFVRANRKCLVNLSCVKTVSAHDAKRLLFILMDGRKIVCSRLCSIALRRKFAL